MLKDKRYIATGHLIKDGRIKIFEEIFSVLPKSVLAADLGMNNSRFEKLRKDISLFKFKDILRMADLFEVNEEEVADLLFTQYEMNKRKGK